MLRYLSGRRPVRLAVAGLSSAAAIGLLAGAGLSELAPQAKAQNGAVPGAQASAPLVQPAWPGYADLVEQLMPSVVTVTTTKSPRTELMSQQGPMQHRFEGPGGERFERFMERFFDGAPGGFGGMPQMPQPGPMMGTGSGFIIAADGLIATNNHVVADSETITVTLHDGSEHEAELIGADPDTDLALIKIAADHDLPFANFGDSDQVRVGDPVIAIGNPFGLGGTVTAGIISAQSRDIGAGRFDDFLQIDAPINRGNSGGPAFNLAGQVIGINTAIQSPTGGNVGIGFAIPANLAKQVIEDLREDGVVERGWLGVQIQPLDEDLAASLDLEAAEGALVVEVNDDSPAARAGVESGDVITAYNGQAIATVRDLTRAVAGTDPGKATTMTVWRDGGEQSLSVDIGEMPGQEQVAAATQDRALEDSEGPRLGVSLAELDDAARAELDVDRGVTGAVVVEVQPGSPAAAKGLRAGDIIIQADEQAVHDPDAVAQAVRDAAERGEEAILLRVQRDGMERFVAIRLENA